MDVVNKIKKVETTELFGGERRGGMSGIPAKDVIIKSIRREEK
jgi:hypothetical protein